METAHENKVKNCSNIFDDDYDCKGSFKVTTEVFDRTLPSQLEFDDELRQQNLEQITEGLPSIKQTQQIAQLASIQNKISPEISTEYLNLTKNVLVFTLKKKQALLQSQQHNCGSYIPYEMKIKTFEIKYYDEESEVLKNLSKLQKFWRGFVGHVKGQLYLKNGFIYLLERKKEGFYIQIVWKIEYLFKIFSDKDEMKLRLIFRQKINEQIKLITRQFKYDDLNLLAHLLKECEMFEITLDK